MESSSEQFISHIKKSSERELASRGRKTSHRLSGLLRFLGWFVIALGAAVTLGFFILMESVYGQLGATANTSLAATMESTAQLREISASVGLDWFPSFMKIYSIRYPIVLALTASTACLGFALLYSARTKKDSQ